jgi:hypothetical protein
MCLILERIARARRHADHVNPVIDWEPFKSAEARDIIVSAERVSPPFIPGRESFDRRETGG